MKKMKFIIGMINFIDDDFGIGSCKNMRELDSKRGIKTLNNSRATNE